MFLYGGCIDFGLGFLQGVPQILLCRVQYLKEVLLFPALTRGDMKVIGGLACLLSEIGQAVSMSSLGFPKSLLRTFFYVLSTCPFEWLC